MKSVRTEDAPAALGPYSQAIQSAGFVYTAGQIGLDPATGELTEGVEAQTHRVMQNLRGVLAAVGLDFGDVVKTTVFLADMDDFGAMNEAYARYFDEPYPARSTVQAARLPKDARIEVEVVARCR